MSQSQAFRITALSEATRVMEYTEEVETAEQVIQRARAYLDFLTGTEKEQQPSQQGTHDPSDPANYWPHQAAQLRKSFPERVAESRRHEDRLEVQRQAYNRAIEDVLALRDKHRLHPGDSIRVEQAWHAIRGLRKN